jgi:hypothetical protein
MPVSSIGFAVAASGTTRILATVAAACILAILVGSGVRQVPIQRARRIHSLVLRLGRLYGRERRPR